MPPSQFIEYAGRVLVELEEARIKCCKENIEDLIRREFPLMTEEQKAEKCKEIRRAAFQKSRKQIPDVLRDLISGNYQPAMNIFHHHLYISICAAMSSRMRGKYELPDQLRALRAGLIWKKLHALQA
jgi:hypothetical protein